MAYVRQMWLNSGMSGRADKTSNVYTKINGITGKTFAVMLRNPLDYDKLNDEQKQHCNLFGALSNGVSLWLAQCKAAGADAADKAVYEKLVKRLRAQHRYATLRGLVMAKHASVNAELTHVTVKVEDYEKELPITFMARPVVTNPEDGFDGGSTDNSGSTDSGNQGSAENPTTGDFTIKATVGVDGGGSVTIKKNGQLISGNTVKASANDTVVIQAVPESDNFQFMSWSDGNSQNPRTIQPSADMNVAASFLDLSRI
ncbi:MAG: hypothetical protein IKI44_05015 [Bacteroidaceae bacterium]|nr:hypothetical protein [Bacteroidaceae bacterium]MBR7052334.1 hypothetical protein [Bacteroidaceae bacterium]